MEYKPETQTFRASSEDIHHLGWSHPPKPPRREFSLNDGVDVLIEVDERIKTLLNPKNKPKMSADDCSVEMELRQRALDYRIGILNNIMEFVGTTLCSEATMQEIEDSANGGTHP